MTETMLAYYAAKRERDTARCDSCPAPATLVATDCDGLPLQACATHATDDRLS